MRIGISIASSHSVDDPRHGATLMIERARAAEGAGLDTLTLGDHHARSSPYFQNTPMLGRLLAEWTGQAGCLFLAPLWNPVLMAEHIGTLASLTPHRFIVQVGIGEGTEQFAAMGADTRHRGRDTEAVIDAVSRLLAGERVSDPELGMHDAVISPITAEPVEWWIAAGAPVGLDRAARLGDAWYCGPGAPPEVAVRQLGEYRSARAAHGLDEGRPIIRRDMIICASGAEAESRGRELIDRGYRGLPWESVVCGDPTTVAAQLDVYRSAGFSEVIARCMFVPQPVAVETVELLGEVRRLMNP